MKNKKLTVRHVLNQQRNHYCPIQLPDFCKLKGQPRCASTDDGIFLH